MDKCFDWLYNNILTAERNGAYRTANSNKNNGLYKTKRKKYVAKRKRTCNLSLIPWCIADYCDVSSNDPRNHKHAAYAFHQCMSNIKNMKV